MTTAGVARSFTTEIRNDDQDMRNHPVELGKEGGRSEKVVERYLKNILGKLGTT